MIEWPIPVPAPHLAVTVRVGARGPVVPATRSRVLVGGQARPATQMQVTYPVSSAPLTVRLSMHDLAAVAPEDARVQLHATVYHAQGIQTHVLSVTVDNRVPDGRVYALITPDGTYLTAELPDTPLTLTVTTEDGGTYQAAAPGAGVRFLPGERRVPATVTATDEEGRESDDLLAGLTIEPDGPADATDLSAWPLPPYLRADAPNLSVILGAFEGALDVRPDLAGLYLSPRTSAGAALTRMGALYGATRLDNPTDSDMRRRILAALTPNKASLEGLRVMLRAHGIFGGTVEDAETLAGPDGPLFFDGTWNFDGSKNFDGGTPGWDVVPGQVIGVFRREPVAGLGAALRVLRRYKAAGIHARVQLREQRRAATAAPGMRLVFRAARTFPMLYAPYTDLVFDGTWNFDGSQNFDGVKP